MLYRPIFVLAGLFAVVLFAASAVAQQDRDLQDGQTETSVIDSENLIQVFTYRSAGETINITIENNSGVALAAVVTDENGDILGYGVDDSLVGEVFLSRIELPEGRIYVTVMRAGGLNSVAEVVFSIVLDIAPAQLLRDENLLSDISLITGEPCDAPCWNEIIPGKTEWSTAVSILENSSQLENIQTAADEESSAVAAEFQGVGGISCCQMVSSGGEIVDAVFLRLAPNITVQDLIQSIGEPAYSIADIFTDDQAIVNLIYPELNTVVYAFVAGAEAELTELSEIIGVLYVTSSDMQAIIDTSNLHEWEGYTTYSTYSRGNEDFEVTPSVTLTPTAEASGS